jgi:ABC-type sugar transport system permease subunit
MSAPLLGLAVLLRATDALKQFDLVMAITGPNDATTQTLSALIYQVVFRGYKVGLGSAYGVVILVAVIAVATIFVRYIDALNRRRGAAEA